jgi:threonine/homoserine/homoserine lactone efflux protein
LPFLAAGQSGPDAAGHRPSFIEGLTINLLNPAIVTFYLAVVPAFMPPSPPRGYFAVLAATHVLMALAVHATWVLALQSLRRLFSRPSAGRTLEVLTGAALVALAAQVLGRL